MLCFSFIFLFSFLSRCFHLRTPFPGIRAMDCFLMLFRLQAIRDSIAQPVVPFPLRSGTAVHELFRVLLFFLRSGRFVLPLS